MFGSVYSKYPEILLDSFGEMKKDYEKKIKVSSSSSLIILMQKIYIGIFGIPEIGFQVRSMHFKDLQKNIKKKNINKILDAGSGIGAYTFWLSKIYPKAKVDGFDIDKGKLEFSKSFAKELGFKNAKFYYADISKGKGRNKYDLIVNVDVLEHINNYKKTLSNFYNLLNNSGYLYIHTPQLNQIRIFKQLNKWYHEDHAREGFDPEKLKKELESLGFKTIKSRNTFGSFGSLAWELNHLLLSKSLFLAGIVYPLLLLIAQVDIFWKNKKGLGIAILAKK